MDDLENFNSEQAFNNVRNGTWDFETFQDWYTVKLTEERNDALYYANL